MHKLSLLLATSVIAAVLIIPDNVASQFNLDTLKAQFLPGEWATPNLSLDDAKKLLREKCRKESGDNETAYTEAQKALVRFPKCISNIANISEIQKEMEIARPQGDLDVVFAKYCNKKGDLMDCVTNLNENIYPCLNSDERSHNDVMMKLLTKLLGFVCFKNGDQIALFIAEEGPECVEENKENINRCLNSSFAGYLPTSGALDISNLPQFVIRKKDCFNILEFQQCVLEHLEKCKEITPSNIIESVFRFVNNETQCQPIFDQRADRSDGVSYNANVMLIAAVSILTSIRLLS